MLNLLFKKKKKKRKRKTHYKILLRFEYKYIRKKINDKCETYNCQNLNSYSDWISWTNLN